MSDEISEAVASSASPAARGSLGLPAYVPLPVMVTPVPIGAVALIGAMFVIIPLIVVPLAYPSGMTGGVSCMLWLIFGLQVAMMAGVTIFQSLRNSRREREMPFELYGSRRDQQRLAELPRMFFDLEWRVPRIVVFRRKRWTWSELQREIEQRSVEPARCVAESLRRPKLEAIPLTPEMLEPEQITSGSALSARMTVALPIIWVLFMAPGLVAGRNWLLFAVFALMLLISIARLPWIRQRVPWVAERSASPIAGLGVIESSRGKRWTVHNAIMLLLARSSSSAIRIYLFGEAGWMMFTFADETDPEFIKLWRRWNHPHPRPELLG